MNTPFNVVLFLLISLNLSAQSNEKTFFIGDVISDTTTFKENAYRKGLNPIVESKHKIEIRLINSNAYDYTNYTVMTFDEEWSGKHYFYKPHSDSLFISEIDDSINLDTIFSKLVANNVFSLPDQDSLRLKKFSYQPATDKLFFSEMGVSHGDCYYLEFKLADFYRRYRYYSPDSYADFFPLIPELLNFVQIVNIIGTLNKE